MAMETGPRPIPSVVHAVTDHGDHGATLLQGPDPTELVSRPQIPGQIFNAQLSATAARLFHDRR
jgi:hypothetical protein